MNNLLPPNATPQETALAGTTERIDAIPVKSRQMWNPQTCPAELLPWLAWALSVDEWNADWSEQQKRNTIAASFRVHSTKGTLAAVKTSLMALGYDSTVIEWFQQPGELEPYTFTVDIDAALTPITGDIFNEATRLIEQTKNTRSHLARLRVATSAPVNFFAAAAQLYGVYCATGGALSVVGGRPKLLKANATALSSVVADMTSVATRYFAVGHINGNILIYKVEGQTFTLLGSPDVVSNNTIFSIDFSPNADYMVAALIVSPFIMIYKRTGDTFTKLPNPSVLPGGEALGGARFSPDGNFLAVCFNGVPAIRVYARSGDTFTRLTDPVAVGNRACGWSRDGTYLVAGSKPSVFLRSGTTFTLLADPSQPLSGFTRAAAFSPVSDLIVATGDAAPRVSVSSVVAGVHVKHDSPASLPVNTGNSVAFNPAGTIVAVGANDGLFLYTVSGTTLTRIANPSGVPTSSIQTVAFNHDGTMFMIGRASSPFVVTYAVSGTTFTQISNPTSLLAAGARGLDFS